MKETVVIALERFSEDAEKLAEMADADLLNYEQGIFEQVFRNYRGIIALMSAGIVVRSISPLLDNKWTDPYVVVVTPDLRFAVPVVGGHHGGNNMARKLAVMGVIPVISTATETKGIPSVEVMAENEDFDIINKDSTRAVNAALLDGKANVSVLGGPSVLFAGPGVSVLFRKGDYIVGLGCRRGVNAEEVVTAVDEVLGSAGIRRDEVIAYATTEKKLDEKGLIDGVHMLGGNLVFISDEDINAEIPASASRASDQIGLVGVAEPSALALSKRKEIIMGKKIVGRVTVAVIR